MEDAIHDVAAREFTRDAPDGAERSCRLAVEEVLVLRVEDVGTYVLMWTPVAARDLAVGFAFTEGLISGLDDIVTLSHCEDAPNALHMRVADPEGVRTVLTAATRTSSCGVCSSTADAATFFAAPPCVDDTFRVAAERLPRFVEQMRACQRIFRETGGTHAVSVVDANGELVAVAEDVGRHNALDKAIGACILSGRTTKGCALVLSGRVSFELVAKAARAGIELLAAVSAPSSLAVRAADACGITLCAFVRGDRATVYTHPHRVSGGAAGE